VRLALLELSQHRVGGLSLDAEMLLQLPGGLIFDGAGVAQGVALSVTHNF
jgi:hypothetical protein